jgi:RNA polymerase sigma factor (sigma-70 family)
MGVARNLARKWLLRESRWKELDDEQFVAESVEGEGREMAESVGAAISRLPAMQREVLLLAHYEGFSLDEIAGIVNIEVGAVKARLHRARQSLKRTLAPLWLSSGGRVNGIVK